MLPDRSERPQKKLSPTAADLSAQLVLITVLTQHPDIVQAVNCVSRLFNEQWAALRTDGQAVCPRSLSTFSSSAKSRGKQALREPQDLPDHCSKRGTTENTVDCQGTCLLYLTATCPPPASVHAQRFMRWPGRCGERFRRTGERIVVERVNDPARKCINGTATVRWKRCRSLQPA